jgi:hypothetical protein
MQFARVAQESGAPAAAVSGAAVSALDGRVRIGIYVSSGFISGYRSAAAASAGGKSGIPSRCRCLGVGNAAVGIFSGSANRAAGSLFDDRARGRDRDSAIAAGRAGAASVASPHYKASG